MSVYKLALYAGVTLISIATVLFVFDNPRNILGNFDLDTEQDLEAFAIARNASTNYYDETGALSHTFKSQKLSHFRPTDDGSDAYTSVESPDIVVFGEREPWHMRADSGRVNADQIITLSENVQLEHFSIDQRVTTLKTSELVLDTDNKVAYTSKAVTISSSLGEITAVGMEADITDRKIKLLSKVKGRHQPQKFTE